MRKHPIKTKNHTFKKRIPLFIRPTSVRNKCLIVLAIIAMILSSLTNLFLMPAKTASAATIYPLTVVYVVPNNQALAANLQTKFTLDEINSNKLEAATAIPGYEIDNSKTSMTFNSLKPPSFNNGLSNLTDKVKLLINDPKYGNGIIPYNTILTITYKPVISAKINYSYTAPEATTSSPISDHPSVTMPFSSFPGWFLTDKIVIDRYQLNLATSTLTSEGVTKALKDWFPTATVNNVQAQITVFLSSKVPTSDITLALNYKDRIAIVGNMVTVNPGDPVNWTQLVKSVTVEGTPMTDFSKVVIMDANNKVINTATTKVDTSVSGSTLYHLTYSDGKSTSNIGNATVGVRGNVKLITKYVDAANNVSLQDDNIQSTFGPPAINFAVPQDITKNGYVYTPVVTKSSLSVNTDGTIEGPVIFDSSFTSFSDVISKTTTTNGVIGSIIAKQTTYTMTYGYLRQITLTTKNTVVSVGDTVKPTDLVKSITLGGKAVDLATVTIVVRDKEKNGNVVPINTSKKAATDYWLTFADGTNVSTPQKATVTVYPKATVITNFVDGQGKTVAPTITQPVTNQQNYVPFAPAKAINGVMPSINKSHYEHLIDTNPIPVVSEDDLSVFDTTVWADIFKTIYRTSGGDEGKGFTFNSSMTTGSTLGDTYTLTYVYEPQQVAVLQVEGVEKEKITGIWKQPIKFMKYSDANLAVAGMTYKVLNPNGNVYNSLAEALAAVPDGQFDSSEIIGGIDQRIQTFNVIYQPISVPDTGISSTSSGVQILPILLVGVSVAGLGIYLKRRKLNS